MDPRNDEIYPLLDLFLNLICFSIFTFLAVNKVNLCYVKFYQFHSKNLYLFKQDCLAFFGATSIICTCSVQVGRGCVTQLYPLTSAPAQRSESTFFDLENMSSLKKYYSKSFRWRCAVVHFLRLTISNRKCIRFFAYINIETKIYLKKM